MTVAIVGIAGTVAQSTAATIADAVRSVAEILGREVPEIAAAVLRWGARRRWRPPTE